MHRHGIVGCYDMGLRVRRYPKFLPVQVLDAVRPVWAPESIPELLEECGRGWGQMVRRCQWSESRWCPSRASLTRPGAGATSVLCASARGAGRRSSVVLLLARSGRWICRRLLQGTGTVRLVAHHHWHRQLSQYTTGRRDLNVYPGENGYRRRTRREESRTSINAVSPRDTRHQGPGCTYRWNRWTYRGHGVDRYRYGI